MIAQISGSALPSTVADNPCDVIEPEGLTEREREVLALVNRGLTNDQIADRLGISSDGVKYHISQAMSKLGAASHYDVAEIARRRSRAWSPWLWLRVAAAAGTVIAVALLGLLLLGVLKSGTGNDSNGVILTPEQLVGRVAAAAQRHGEILHSRVQVDRVGGVPADYSSELWLDPTQDGLRGTFPTAGLPTSLQQSVASNEIVIGRVLYFQPDLVGSPVRYNGPECPGSNAPWLAIFLDCRGGEPALPSIAADLVSQVKWDASVELGDYSDHPALVLVFTSEPPSRTPAPSATPGLSGVVRVYIDPNTYLPLVEVFTESREGQTVDQTNKTYDNQFVPRDASTRALFEPTSIGYSPGVTPTN